MEREVLAPLRKQTFTSLADLNAAIRERLELLNTRPLQKLEGSRRELFDAIERPALKALPAERYEYAEQRQATVNIDYHISVDKHLYSVPYHLVREKVVVRLTTTTLEVLHKGKRIAVHLRSRKRGGVTTDPAHRPKSHQHHLEWTPSRLVRWAESIGTATAGVVEEILRRKPHPEMGYRACLGLFSLGRRYGADRLERAAARALQTGAVSYGSLKSMLAKSLDRAPLPAEPSETRLPQAHANIRGREYYGQDERSDGVRSTEAAKIEGTPGPPDGRSALGGQMWSSDFLTRPETQTDHRS